MAKKAPQHPGFKPRTLNPQSCAYTSEALDYSAQHLLMGGIHSIDDYQSLLAIRRMHVLSHRSQDAEPGLDIEAG